MHLPVDLRLDQDLSRTLRAYPTVLGGVAEVLQSPEAGHTATTKRATHSAFISTSQIPSYSLYIRLKCMRHAQTIFVFLFLFWCELVYPHVFNFLISLCMKISRIIFDSEVRLFFQCLQTPVLKEAKQRPIIFSNLTCRTTVESCGATFLSMVENRKT